MYNPTFKKIVPSKLRNEKSIDNLKGYTVVLRTVKNTKKLFTQAKEFSIGTKLNL